MAKMYTLDKKLLIGSPVIQIGDMTVTIDDRVKTVRKVLKLTKNSSEDMDELDLTDEVLKLVLSPADYKKLDKSEIPYAAHEELMTLVMAAILGKDPDEDGFREEAAAE